VADYSGYKFSVLRSSPQLKPTEITRPQRPSHNLNGGTITSIQIYFSGNKVELSSHRRECTYEHSSASIRDNDRDCMGEPIRAYAEGTDID